MEECTKKKKNRARTTEGRAEILTPELVVVAAALRLPAAVAGLADVALVVGALAVQQTLQDTSTVPFYPFRRMYLQCLSFPKNKNGPNASLSSLWRGKQIEFYYSQVEASRQINKVRKRSTPTQNIIQHNITTNTDNLPMLYVDTVGLIRWILTALNMNVS